MLTRRILLRGLTGSLIGLWAGKAVRAKGENDDPYRSKHIDLGREELSLHWQQSNGALYETLEAVKEDLERQGKTVLALTNAGIYGRDMAPLGLHVEAGQQLVALNRAKGGGNFFLQPNGVFYIANGKAGVLRTSDYARLQDELQPQLATQSGPLLFDGKGIHPRFLRNATSTYIRNAVGVKENGDVVLTISTRPVTFWQLATYLKDVENCSAALYLDGSISALWQQGEPMPVAFRPFVGILAVTEKQKAEPASLE